jgi:hypothetical protein
VIIIVDIIRFFVPVIVYVLSIIAVIP